MNHKMLSDLKTKKSFSVNVRSIQKYKNMKFHVLRVKHSFFQLFVVSVIMVMLKRLRLHFEE